MNKTNIIETLKCIALLVGLWLAFTIIYWTSWGSDLSFVEILKLQWEHITDLRIW